MSAAALVMPTAVSAGDVAQAQLDAYNARDLEAFAACYADEVEVYDFPGQLRYSGQAALREFYARRFAVPTLKAVAKSRAVIGDRVIDHEVCWLNGTDQPPVELVVIYTVEAGLIRRVDFLR